MPLLLRCLQLYTVIVTDMKEQFSYQFFFKNFLQNKDTYTWQCPFVERCLDIPIPVPGLLMILGNRHGMESIIFIGLVHERRKL